MNFGRNGSRSCEGWVGAKQLESVGEAKNSPCDPICHCTNVAVWETQWSITEVWTLATGTKKQCAKNTHHLTSYIYSYIIGDNCHTGDAYCLDCTHKACSKSSKQILAISPCWQKITRSFSHLSFCQELSSNHEAPYYSVQFRLEHLKCSCIMLPVHHSQNSTICIYIYIYMTVGITWCHDGSIA